MDPSPVETRVHGPDFSYEVLAVVGVLVAVGALLLARLEGDEGRPVGLILSPTRDRARALAEARPDLPPAFATVVEKALEDEAEGGLGPHDDALEIAPDNAQWRLTVAMNHIITGWDARPSPTYMDAYADRKWLAVTVFSGFALAAAATAMATTGCSPSQEPSLPFNERPENARRQARKAGMKRSDIKDAVAEVRGRR